MKPPQKIIIDKDKGLEANLNSVLIDIYERVGEAVSPYSKVSPVGVIRKSIVTGDTNIHQKVLEGKRLIEEAPPFSQTVLNTVTLSPNPVVITVETPSVQNPKRGVMKCYLEWGAVTEITGRTVKYEIQWWIVGESTIVEKTSTKQTNITLKNLDANKVYGYYVLAYDWQKNYTDPQSGPPTFSSSGMDVEVPGVDTISPTNPVIGALTLTSMKGKHKDLYKWSLAWTASVDPELMTLDAAATPADFAPGATVHGDTSAKTVVVVAKLTSLTYTVKDRSGTFTLGEVLHDGVNSANQGEYYPTFAGGTLAGYEIEIIDVDSTPDEVVITETAGKNDTSKKGKGLAVYNDAGTAITYQGKVRAYDKDMNYSGWSALSSATSTVDTTVPANPADIVLTVKADEFEITFTKSTSEIMKNGGYKLYAWGSDDSGSALVIGDISHPAHKFSIKVGASTYYTGGGNASLSFNTTYYFWVEAYSGVGVPAAAKAATSPTNGKLLKIEWLRSFINPWKMKGKATYHYNRTTVAGTNTHAVASGKVALLEGYQLTGTDGANYTYITVTDGVSGFVLETNIGASIRRSPAFTNGLYLYYGCSIKLVTVGGTGCAGTMKILEFDSDSDITSVIKYLDDDTSYTVPAGKGLTVTFLWVDTGTYYLQQYINAAWENVWDVGTELWELGKGCLYFPPGSIVGGSGNNIYVKLIGFLTDDT